ncbi:MAG: hypothetical protein K8S25_16070 [Alphaproteobacteria bacterium]|nr:hypothetical protein [Alphaproteobacteria bacterium]
MAKLPNLKSVRAFLSHRGMLLLFGAIYLVSQIIIATVVGPLVPERMVGLQVTGFTPADYIATFSAWKAEGVMAFYHAHLIFDDAHWIWYSIFLSVALALSLDAARLSDRWNVVLTFPLIAGINDWFENGLQHVFLSADGYQMVIDPLPAISTTASIIKWVFFLGSFLLIAGMQLSRLRRGT